MIVAQGGTVRLPAVYRDASNALVDPSNPSVEIMRPDASVAITAVPVRESIGEFHYDFTVPAGAALGGWVARFTGVIGGATVAGDEAFTVVEPGSVGAGGSDLITLAELRSKLGVHVTDTRKDALYESMIPAASAAIRSFTERDFGAPTVTEERTFEYDGSGYLDIDDAAEVTQVAFVNPLTADLVLDSDLWQPKPSRRDDAPVYYYVIIGSPGSVGSPEMGFARNLDVYAREGRLPGLTATAKVTATWGWPTVPEDVKMAATWTIREWLDRPSGDALTAEAIEGWSRTWGGRGGAGGAAALAIPARARDLLANYAKLSV